MAESSETQLNQKNYINILVLGESVVEKSTFINVLPNYLTFDSIIEAKDSPDLVLIPMSFTFNNTSEDIVKFGTELDENNSADGPQAQGCKSYEFSYCDPTDRLVRREIRLIDTPAVKDPHSIDQNWFKNILYSITEFKELHSICILLKNNNEIKIAEFWIKQILSHFQKSACNNVIFVFPNNTSKLVTVDTSLTDVLNTMNIAFNKDIVYYIDSKAFIAMIGLKNRIVFTELDINWDTSAKESHRFIQYILGTNDGKPGLTAHGIWDNICVIESRHMIVILSDLKTVIEKDIKDIEEDIESYNNTIDVELKSIDLLKGSHVVCTVSPKCCDVLKGGLERNFRTVCHYWCECSPDVEKNLYGDKGLKNCQCFTGGDNCSKCGCNYANHLLVSYDPKAIESQIHLSDIEKQILIKSKIVKNTQKILENIVTKNEIIEKELNVISKYKERFAIFLKTNAITPYNDVFKQFVEDLMKNEDSNIGSNNTQLLANYEKEKNILDIELKAIIEKDIPVSTEDVFNGIQELYKLNIYGKRIQDLIFAQNYFETPDLCEESTSEETNKRLKFVMSDTSMNPTIITYNCASDKYTFNGKTVISLQKYVYKLKNIVRRTQKGCLSRKPETEESNGKISWKLSFAKDIQWTEIRITILCETTVELKLFSVSDNRLDLKPNKENIIKKKDIQMIGNDLIIEAILNGQSQTELFYQSLPNQSEFNSLIIEIFY